MKNKLVFSILFLSVLAFYACKKDRTTVVMNNNNGNGNTPTSYRVNAGSMWTKSAPKKQTFTIDPSMGQLVTGAKGFMFYFPANSLLDASNNPVTGNVSIELIEYVTKGDMLLSGVTVTSGNQLLESGGMFYLMAKKNGQELHLKDNSSFSMSIPQTNKNADPMDIWLGQPNVKDSLNKINWVLKDSVKIQPKKDTAGQGTPRYSMNFNYFKFGYVNIDRECYKFKTLVSKFRVKMPKGCNDTNSTALLLFKDYNCCAWCYWLMGEGLITTGYQLPLGESAKVLVYKKTGKGDDDLEFAIREFTFTDDTEVEFTSTAKCTNQQLEDMIKAL